MERIARFEKVSYENFKKAMEDLVEDYFSNPKVAKEYIEKRAEAIYKDIKLPKRATIGSAGYDFFAPFDFILKPNETIKIPTGIRCQIVNGWVLQCYPRSGLGFKYRLQLDNTVGIIDSDYFFSDNEGHIFIKITNCTNKNKIIDITKGDGFAQGIFVPFGITADDSCDGIRNGGFGSTSKEK